MEWRFKNHDNPYMFRDTVKRVLGTPPLTYREQVDGGKSGENVKKAA